MSYPEWARTVAGKMLTQLKQTTALERGISDRQAREVVRGLDDPKVRMLWQLYHATFWG